MGTPSEIEVTMIRRLRWQRERRAMVDDDGVLRKRMKNQMSGGGAS